MLKEQCMSFRKLSVFIASALSFLLLTGFIRPNEGRYIKAATYFSDDYVGNFWNSESISMDREMQRISDDGFNSIIIAVPWREFQPNPGQYEEYAIRKLDRVMQTAGAHQLSVILRVGYTWGGIKGMNGMRRIQRLPVDPNMKNAWLDYVKKIYRSASIYPNFGGGFLTWEDFWTITSELGSQGNSMKSVKDAADSGYAEFARTHYSMEELRQLYQDDSLTKETIYFPRGDSGARKVMLEWFDDYLNSLLKQSQNVFPNLSLETRLDVDPVQMPDGSTHGVSHESTFSVGNASYSATMYSVQMGIGGSLDAMAVLPKTAELLGRAGFVKPVFVDQFLFTDNTPGFEQDARFPNDEEINRYLQNVSPVLKEHSIGYGIWTYRDYADNVLYNAQFALGRSGWEFSGQAKVVSYEGSNAAKLNKGGGIAQKLPWEDSGRKPAAVKVQMQVDGSGTIRVLGDQDSRIIKVGGKQTVDFDFGQTHTHFQIECLDGEVYLDDIKAYTFITEGKLYHENGAEGTAIASIRELNQKLR